MSRLIKSGWSNPNEENKRVISIKRFINETEEITKNESAELYQKDNDAILEQAKFEAESIILEANDYKKQLLQQLEQKKSEWETERAQIEQMAKETGFETGMIEGKNQGYHEMQDVIQKAKEVVSLSKEDYLKKIESAEDTVLALSLKVAEKILGLTLNENSDSFLSLVRNTLKEARDYPEVQLHIHPAHYEFIISQKEDLMNIFPKETELYIFPDEELSKESCIIESTNGRIDASVDVQLAQIKEKLYELLESE